MKNSPKKSKKNLSDLTAFINDDSPAAEPQETGEKAIQGDAVSKIENGQAKSASKSEKDTRKADLKAKRAELKAEKAKKRARLRNDDAVVYSTEKMNGFRFSVPIGYFLRFFSIALSVFGICALLADSFELAGVNLWLLLLFCIGAVSAFSLIFIGGKPIFAGIGIIIAYNVAIFIFIGSPLTFLVSGFEAVFNGAMKTLSDYGYAAFSEISLPALGQIHSESENLLINGGMEAIALLLSLIFSIFSAKRTRLLPMLIFGGAVCVLCFTYNLTGTNTGIMCILAGLCSTVVLSAYDRLYAAHENKADSRKSRAYSGFSSALSGLLVLAVLAAPASSIKNPWREIGAISSPIQSARTIVMTILTGGDPRLNVMNSLVESRSVKLDKIEFTGAELFEVKTYLRNQNVYLRSWIGGSFDSENDSWNLLSDDDYKEMQSQLRAKYGSITGDSVTYMLYRNFDKWLGTDSFPDDSFYGDPSYGYYASFVDVGSIKSSGLLYTLPSLYASGLGIYEYGSRTSRYSEAVSLYSDGIYKSGWLNLKKEFSAPAILPCYTDKKYAKTAAAQAEYTNLLYSFIKSISSVGSSTDDDSVRERFEKILADAGLSKYGTAGLDSYLESSNRRKWITDHISAYEDYGSYVKSFYTNVTASEGVSEITEEIRPDFEAAETDFDKIMTVVNYLIANYDYTTEPDKPSGIYASDVDSFLLETKNGYCVQFATAATLILRNLGIPARYVQGYVAGDFGYVDGKVYKSTVTDEDAHAWVEVWMDGLGWRTIEVTPGYYSSLYYIDSSSNSEISEKVTPTTTKESGTTAAETDETEAPVTTDDTGGEDNEPLLDTSDIIAIVIVLSIAVIAAAAIIIIMKRSKKIRSGRSYYIERAIYGSFTDGDDLAAAAGVLTDFIYQMIYISVGKPKIGETPVEFARRIDCPPKPVDKNGKAAVERRLKWPYTFGKVTEIIEKREFSGNVSRDELIVLGEFAAALEKIEYPHLSAAKKIKYRYLFAVI